MSSSGQHKSEFQVMPTLSSFQSSQTKGHNSSSSSSSSSRTSLSKHNSNSPYRRDYTNMAPTVTTTTTAGDNSASRHVTFSSPAYSAADLGDVTMRHPPEYEHLFPEENGLYISVRRSTEDEDGNTTTSGSYTIDTDYLNDSISAEIAN